MKLFTNLKAALFCLVFVLMASYGHAQDLIVKKNGEEVVGKIVKVGADTIHYRMVSDERGPLRFVLRGDVATMQLATTPSQKQQLDEYASTSTGVVGASPVKSLTAEELMYQGRHDALVDFPESWPFRS